MIYLPVILYATLKYFEVLQKKGRKKNVFQLYRQLKGQLVLKVSILPSCDDSSRYLQRFLYGELGCRNVAVDDVKALLNSEVKGLE